MDGETHKSGNGGKQIREILEQADCAADAYKASLHPAYLGSIDVRYDSMPWPGEHIIDGRKGG